MLLFNALISGFRLMPCLEGDGNGGGGGSNGNSSSNQGGSNQGTGFTPEYVHDLREEAKGYRVRLQDTQAKVRKLIGIGEKDDITDDAIAAFSKSLTDMKTKDAATQATLSKASNLLVLAELKGMTEYDDKLAARLLDMSKITVDLETLKVTGVKEALEELVKEFPQIKKGAAGAAGAAGQGTGNTSGLNGANSGNLTEEQQLEAQLEKEKDLQARVVIKNKLHALRKNKS